MRLIGNWCFFIFYASVNPQAYSLRQPRRQNRKRYAEGCGETMLARFLTKRSGYTYELA